MGLRFRRSIKISKGVKVNLGKTGVSTTFGRRGLHYTMHVTRQIEGGRNGGLFSQILPA